MSDVPAKAILEVLRWLLEQPGVIDLLQDRLTPAQAVVHHDTGPLLLTLDQAAEVAGVGKNRMYMLVAGGGIAAIRFGRAIRIPRQAIVEWIRESSRKGSASSHIEVEPNASSTSHSAQRPRPGAGRAVQAVKSGPQQHPPKPIRTQKPLDPYFGVKRIAAKLHISPQKASQMIKTGQIYTRKMGTRQVCLEWHLEEYIRLKGQQPAEGWERYFWKLTYERCTEAEKQEMVEFGFDPVKGTWKHEEDK